MKFSRRDFIKIGGFSVLTASAATAFGQSSLGGDRLSQMRSPDFSTRIGSRFYMTAGARGGEIFETILTEVRDFRTAKTNDGKRRGENFTLVFTVSDGEGKAQATYEVISREMGNFPMFLVPGVGNNGESLLIATFNRL